MVMMQVGRLLRGENMVMFTQWRRNLDHHKATQARFHALEMSSNAASDAQQKAIEMTSNAAGERICRNIKRRSSAPASIQVSVYNQYHLHSF